MSWDKSAQAWIDFVDRGDPSRELLLDPIMLAECGDVAGKRVLDIGCGEGRFMRMLAQRGAQVYGLDPTSALLRSAQTKETPSIILASAELLPIQNESVDMAVFYLTLIDIDDYLVAMREAVRAIRPGGSIVIANLHPICTAGEDWRTDGAGKRLDWPIDRYFEERGNSVAWADIRVINHHRPLSAYFNVLLAGGMVMRSFIEPCPTPEMLAIRPSIASGARIPYFLVTRWTKSVC